MPQMDAPAIEQIHALSGIDILVSPTFDTPTLAQTHVMTGLGISTTPILDTPGMDVYLVEYPADILFGAIYPTADVNAVYPNIEVSVITEV